MYLPPVLFYPTTLTTARQVGGACLTLALRATISKYFSMPSGMHKCDATFKSKTLNTSSNLVCKKILEQASASILKVVDIICLYMSHLKCEEGAYSS
jgi:hypothetical protein